MNERTERPREGRAKFERQKVHDAIEQLTALNVLESDKVLILLSYVGEKQLGELSVPDNHHFQGHADEIRSILHKLGLKYDEEQKANSGKPIIHFDFSRDLSALEKIRELKMRQKTMSSESWRLAHGKLFGFPDTAIHAFVTHRELLEELPEEVRNTPVGRFYERAVSMRLSKAHWQSELKVVDEWMRAAHEAAPNYISHLVSDSWTPQGGTR